MTNKATKRLCRYRDCKRPAAKGWTMCLRHHSAGDSLVNDRRKRRRPVVDADGSQSISGD